MYLMLTNRCNFSCIHCCQACTAKGSDMSMRTVHRILDRYQPEYLALGGGEPTLHPKFWEILGLSIASCDTVWLATNGSITHTALKLANLAKKGVIGCALSQDCWHDPIDQKVIDAFTKNKQVIPSYESKHRDDREIRNVSEHVINAGRCDFGEDGCTCEGDTFVLPSGKVKQCGCLKSPIVGSVFDDELYPIGEEWICYKQLDKTLLSNYAKKIRLDRKAA